MSNEPLPDASAVVVELGSLPDGILANDIIRWNGVNWVIVQNNAVGSPLTLPSAPLLFDPEDTPPQSNGGYLYKKNGESGLFWYPDGGPEVRLGGGEDVSIPTIGSSTDNALVRWNGVKGSAVSNSGISLNNANEFVLGEERIICFNNDLKNTVLGINALILAIGNENTAVGHYALLNNIAGSFNTATGCEALINNITGSFNTSIGDKALYNNVSGDNNTVLGSLSALVATGSDNTIFGAQAGNDLTTGSGNLLLGAAANVDDADRSGVIVMGAGVISAPFDDSLTVGSIRGPAATIYGLYYNTDTYEITYGPLSGGSGGTLFSDADFLIHDSADITKYLKFQVAAVKTGTTRTFTVPDADGILPARIGDPTNLFVGATSSAVSGSGNTVFGISAGSSLTDAYNATLIGYEAGASLGDGINDTLIGAGANVDVPGRSNVIVLGAGTVSVAYSGSTTIGDSYIRDAVDGTHILHFNSATGEMTKRHTVMLENGTSSVPSMYFVDSSSTGLYSSALDTINIVAGGTNNMTITKTAAIMAVPLANDVGSVNAPAYTFTGDSNTGIYSSADDTVNVAAGGVNALTITKTSAAFAIPLAMGSTAISGVSTIGVSGAGTFGSVVNALGSAMAPSYTFSGDTNTGIYSGDADNFNIATGGAVRMTITNSLNTIATNVSMGSNAIQSVGAITSSGAITTTGSIVNALGSVGAPSYTFASDSNTGIYSSGSDSVNVAAGGVNGLTITKTAATLAVPLAMSAQAITGAGAITSSGAITTTNSIVNALGAAATPSYTFTGDLNTGIYSSAADTVNVATGGVLRATIDNSAATLAVPLAMGTQAITGASAIGVSGAGTFGSVVNALGSAATPSYTFTGDLNTGIYSSAADTVNVATGGVLRATFDNSAATLAVPLAMGANAIQSVGAITSSGAITTTGSVVNALGLVGTPSYTFTGDLNTGIYSSAADTVSIAAGGINTMNITKTAVSVLLGSASAPSYSFIGDLNTGIYSSAADTVNVATGGVLRATFDNSVATLAVPLAMGAQAITGASAIGVSGAGTFGSVVNALGAAATPSYTFTGDLNTGIYSSAADTVNIATGGVLRATIDNSAATLTVPTVAPLGAVGTPSYTFSGDLNTGIYSSAADTVNVATGGVLRATYNNSAATLTVPSVVPLGAAATPSYTFTGDLNTGIYSSAADTVNVATGGVLRATFDNSAATLAVPLAMGANAIQSVGAITTSGLLTTNGSIVNANGTVSTPSYRFANSPNAGFYASALDTIHVATNGINRATFNNSSMTLGVPLIMGSNAITSVGAITASGAITTTNVMISSAGSAPAPTYTFAANTNTGIYSDVAGWLRVAANGTNPMTITSTAVSMLQGTVDAPSYTFTDNLNTGIYSSAINSVDVAAGGINTFTITKSAVSIASGTSYIFGGDTGTGLYSSASNTINVKAGDIDTMTITKSSVDVIGLFKASTFSGVPWTGPMWWIDNCDETPQFMGFSSEVVVSTNPAVRWIAPFPLTINGFTLVVDTNDGVEDYTLLIYKNGSLQKTITTDEISFNTGPGYTDKIMKIEVSPVISYNSGDNMAFKISCNANTDYEVFLFPYGRWAES